MKPLVSHSVLTLLTCIWNKRNVCFPRLKNLGVSWHCIEITPTCFFYLNKTMNSFWKYKISFLDSVTSFSHGHVTFDLLTPGQKQCLKYDDFYNSSLLQEFMEATQVRLCFHRQYCPAEHTADLRHRHYAADEIIISRREYSSPEVWMQCGSHCECSLKLVFVEHFLKKKNIVAELLEQSRFWALYSKMTSSAAILWGAFHLMPSYTLYNLVISEYSDHSPPRRHNILRLRMHLVVNPQTVRKKCINLWYSKYDIDKIYYTFYLVCFRI